MRQVARCLALLGVGFVGSAGCRTPHPSDFLPATGAYMREDRFPDPMGEEAGPSQYEAWAVTDPQRRTSVMVDVEDVSVGVERHLGKGDRAHECARATEGGHRASLLSVDGVGSLLVNGKLSLPQALISGHEWRIDKRSDCELFGRIREVTSEVVSVERNVRCGGEVTLLYIEYWEKGLGRTKVEGADGLVRSRTRRKIP